MHRINDIDLIYASKPFQSKLLNISGCSCTYTARHCFMIERATSDNVNTVLIENDKDEGIAESQLACITNILNIVCLAITQSRPPLELHLPIATFVASLLISPSIVRHSPVYSSSSSPSSLGMTGFSKQTSPRSSPTKA